jgi:hypothetical protein
MCIGRMIRNKVQGTKMTKIELIKAIRKLYDIPTYKLLDLEKETLTILLKDMQNTKKQG